MSADPIDISDSFTWQENLPWPQWDLIRTWVDARVDPADWHAAWTAICNQWLEKLGPALGPNYGVYESESFLLLAPQVEPLPANLIYFAERCRERVLAFLNGVGDFPFAGKQVLLALKNEEDYYRYVSTFFPEGRFGGSAGMHIRAGFAHIAMCGRPIDEMENTLAHEMTHASLLHLSLPQWIEEGLAQMFEHDMTGRHRLMIDEEQANRHKRYWHKHGLDIFWRGEGFTRPGKVQQLNYQLAELLMRLLAEEFSPRWFGWDQKPVRRLLAFLRDANAADCGEASAREHLGLGLHDIAGLFLGPGDWEPKL